MPLSGASVPCTCAFIIHRCNQAHALHAMLQVPDGESCLKHLFPEQMPCIDLQCSPMSRDRWQYMCETATWAWAQPGSSGLEFSLSIPFVTSARSDWVEALMSASSAQSQRFLRSYPGATSQLSSESPCNITSHVGPVVHICTT